MVSVSLGEEAARRIGSDAVEVAIHLPDERFEVAGRLSSLPGDGRRVGLAAVVTSVGPWGASGCPSVGPARGSGYEREGNATR
jgi:hypothetical protein